MASPTNKTIHVLDYGAGNVRSVENALKRCGYTPIFVESPAQLKEVNRLVFPGVGSFASAMKFLNDSGYAEALKEYLLEDKHFFGICLGMQTLFESSEECPGVPGLGLIKGGVAEFDAKATGLSVPHIGWSTIDIHKKSQLFNAETWSGPKAHERRLYFVHSFFAPRITPDNEEWVLATTTYGNEFVSAVQKGNVMATQFHPEKSGELGIDILRGFLERSEADGAPSNIDTAPTVSQHALSKRIIACLDVRSNDDGDLVVTKGESYDVREAAEEKEPVEKKIKTGQVEDVQEAGNTGKVRNLGKPVELCARYYEEGADEVTFLNITSFRSEPLEDAPMLRVLEQASARVFVPLTIGGGIRNYTDKTGKTYSALDVAARYFRAGADKVSIGSDAVIATEALMANDMKPTGTSAIEQISHRYGRQAVVISVDPKRVYVDSKELQDEAKSKGYTVVSVIVDGVERKCWYQCTVQGGREVRPVDAVQLAKGCQLLGAGEILLNSIDADGQKKGFDLALIKAVCDGVTIPVIASSGAGVSAHFTEVFEKTRAEAALAAGIFHRKEVPLGDVKDHLIAGGVAVRKA